MTHLKTGLLGAWMSSSAVQDAMSHGTLVITYNVKFDVQKNIFRHTCFQKAASDPRRSHNLWMTTT